MLRYSHALTVALLLAVPATALAQTPAVAPAMTPLRRAATTAVPAHLAHVVSALTADPAAWAVIASTDDARITALPLGPARSVNVVLSRIDPFTPDAVIMEVTMGPDGKTIERPMPRPRAEFYAGIVEGEPESRVMLANTEAGVAGYVQDSRGLAVISSGPPGSGLPVVSYMLDELPDGAINWDQWACEEHPAGPVFHLNDAGTTEGGTAGAVPCRQVKVAVETDAEFSAMFSSSSQAAAYVATIYAGVLDIYTRDVAARPQVSYLRLWSTPNDPWTATSASPQLSEFRDYWLANMGDVVRNEAHFLSPRNLGGGVAWLSSLCNSYAFAVSGNLNGFFPYPLVDNSGQNWDIIVVAHEMGHNFGAPHTHNYCPPADECAPAGYFGSCQAQQTCVNTGTIMSYCHLCSGGTANIRLNMHPKNIESIVAYLASNGCNMTGTSLPPVGNTDFFNVLGSTAMDLDVLANDIAANCDTVQIANAAAASSQGGSITVVPGAGPDGRDVLRYSPPAGFSGADTLWYRLIEPSGQTSLPIGVDVAVIALRTPENPSGDVPGLTAQYYALSNPAALPRFELITPYLTTTVNSINYTSTNGNFANSTRSDNVGAQWTGWVRVDQPGIYTFFVTSDDGSALRIGDTSVVNNDGLHGMVEKSGTIGLLPGKHALTVSFFEAGGGAGCIVQMSGPGVTKAPIPAGRYTRGGVVNPFDLNGDGLVNGADLGMLLNAFGTANAAADLNGDGVVNGADLGALLSAWQN